MTDPNESFEPREEHKEHHFSLSWLPNTVTLLNLFCGFLSLLMASQGHLTRAVWLILTALIWDSLDGNIARSLKNSTLFGRELDSLADVVSFVVAPAFLVLKSWDYRLDPWTLLAVFCFLGAGAYRLARFNVCPPVKSCFQGLPTPAAAATLSLTVLACTKNEWTDVTLFMFVLIFLMSLMSFLMVSRIAYPKLSVVQFSKWKAFFYVEFIALGGAAFLMNFETALALVFLMFVFLAPAFYFPIRLEEQADEELAAKSLK
ncbi:MAG TPA: CDP-diacylglycerol--serine O-phosphatidyltransferase [Candidatus Omnitrophota bacterium]|nr:CDP-diacylglycerol--serine O-phosphatidyltransferase [Candidatus Omnitrophota bacterium]